MIIDNTSHELYLTERLAYDNRKIKNERNRMTSLEQRIYETTISATDEITYLNRCKYKDEPDELYPKTYWLGKDILLVACRDRPYLNIAIDVLDALLKKQHTKEDFYNMSNNERKMLYDKITKNNLYKYRNKR